MSGRKWSRGGCGMPSLTPVEPWWRTSLGGGRLRSFCRAKSSSSRGVSGSFYTEGWGAYERHIAPEQHHVGKAHTQKIERQHLNLRPRITR